MTPHQWHAAGQYFDFRQHRIFFRQSEAREPSLLLIHGFPTASWDWYRLWPELSRHFHLVAADMLGYGFSDKPRPYNYTTAEQADLHEELLRSIGLEQVHILGHDYGDTVTQELLARQLRGNLSFEILSAVFLNGGMFPDVHRPRPIQKILMSPLGPYLTPFLGKPSLARSFRRIFGPHTQVSEEEMDHFWSLIEFQKGKAVIPRLIRYMQERSQNRNRWVGALQKSLIPMLHINGASDPISGRHVADYYRKVVPQAQVIELDQIGHYPQVEAPARVIEHYLNFFQRHFSGNQTDQGSGG